MTDIDLVEAYIKEIEKMSAGGPPMTFSDFYDKYGVQKEHRTDFGTVALLEQVKKRVKEKEMTTKITLNGKTVVIDDDSNISINNSDITIDGKKIPINGEKPNNVVINGTVGSVDSSLNVEVKGSVEGDLKAGGNVQCTTVEGDIDCKGNTQCGNVEGDVQAGGNLKCGNIEGDAKAGGNIISK